VEIVGVIPLREMYTNIVDVCARTINGFYHNGGRGYDQELVQIEITFTRGGSVQGAAWRLLPSSFGTGFLE
jgi:hypothetical protein